MNDRITACLVICFMAGVVFMEHEVLSMMLVLAAVGISA